MTATPTCISVHRNYSVHGDDIFVLSSLSISFQPAIRRKDNSHFVTPDKFGPKREELSVEWRKEHNQELYNLYSPQNIVRVFKSRRVIWEGHVSRTENIRNVYKIFVGNIKVRDHSEEL
jgi:hypothetical protein